LHFLILFFSCILFFRLTNFFIIILFQACNNGHVEVIKLLLAKDGIDMFKKSTKGLTPLMVATKKNKYHVIELLKQIPSMVDNTEEEQMVIDGIDQVGILKYLARHTANITKEEFDALNLD